LVSIEIWFYRDEWISVHSGISLVERWQHKVRHLIRLKRIYNFWCSMLVLTPFA
jgi:hypothetical protein